MTRLLVKALVVSCVVGTVLFLINQFDVIFGENQLRIIPAILTYCVPFIVFIAGHISNRSPSRQENSKET